MTPTNTLKNSSTLLWIAILIGLVLHGTAMFFTLEDTYDALIHVFFADHYSENWWNHWSPKWYTGFTVTGYPPLVHQCIALFSRLGGLMFGLYSMALIAVVLFITGVYRYAYLLTRNYTIAGITSIFAVVSSSFVETLHVYGQLPSIIGISILLHALTPIYNWVRHKDYIHLLSALALVAVTVASHHVTPIFGMVFFIFPVIGLALLDKAAVVKGGYREVRIKHFLIALKKSFWRIVTFGFSSLALIITIILPYWINSKNNPITQVPIPHGSRDNYLEVLSSGFIFFVVPWGVLFCLLQYFFIRFYSKRFIFFGISLTILFVFGTGGSTPIPLLLLGENAFNILTLDRFTLWATILVLPLLGEFIHRFVNGDIRKKIIEKMGAWYYKGISLALISVTLALTIFTLILFTFRPSQPEKIDTTPIVNFLNQDDHDRWRYLTLGFGDQMAWLSTQTEALTVDGNYHSARRLPELTTKAVERLENSKYLGVEGLGSLQQFLTVPHKYHLKYIFSNDKFYDPLLFFAGWNRVTALDNGIIVWERSYVPPLPQILPSDPLPRWQQLMWGTLPITTVVFAIFTIFILPLSLNNRGGISNIPSLIKSPYSSSNSIVWSTHLWMCVVLLIGLLGCYKVFQFTSTRNTPDKVISKYLDAIDVKNFDYAYTLLNPRLAPEKETFYRQISVSDGILNSYSKLNALSTITEMVNDTIAKVQVEYSSITPLDILSTEEEYVLTKIGKSWYINPEDIPSKLPPNLYQESPTLDIYMQGRRRVNSKNTSREDILPQPEVIVLESSLIKNDSEYSIVGRIMNIDKIPADISLLGSLYDDENNLLASYSSMFVQQHILLPNESTHFRIDFEQTAWIEDNSSKPTTFDPNLKSPLQFDEEPTTFDLHISTNAASSIPYEAVSINNIAATETSLKGDIYNSGTKEITIPQLILGYYDFDNTLIWTDYAFLRSNLRQSRTQHFDIPLNIPKSIVLINSDISRTYCNGISVLKLYQKNNLTYPRSSKLSNSAISTPKHNLLIEVNNFIGN